MRIVVTGALGHIGSRLIREIPTVFPDAQVIMIDNLLTERYESLVNLPTNGKFLFHRADICHADLENLFNGADVVIHLAALTHTSYWDALHRVNVVGTERVARACARLGCQLLFPSTTSVYSKGDGFVDETCEGDDLKPQSAYAASKRKSEEFLHQLEVDEGLRFANLRFGTIFGVSPGMQFKTAVNRFCQQAINQEALSVWKTAWHQKRPYLDLKDAVSAILFVLEKQLFFGKTYNVVTLNTTVERIVRRIAREVANLRVQFVESEIMNAFSYEVLSTEFERLGFEYYGDLDSSIDEILIKLREAKLPEKAVIASETNDPSSVTS